ncbi:MAG: glycosyltransferase family 4 protein [bacterium]|nr:glycosyltransferase family 4 protein [bacterium]
MKILHVTGDWKWTGPAEPMLHAVTGLRERGHEVDLVCPSAPPDEDGGVEVHARNRGLDPVLTLAPGQGFRPFRDRQDVRRLRELLANRGYDVIHAHHTRDHILLLRARRRGQGKLVVSWHHGDPIPPNLWNRWLFGPTGSDAVAVLTQELAEVTRKSIGGIASRVGVVPGCVDSQRFSPREPSETLQNKLGLAPDSRVIGLVARLQLHRRVDLLLDAFACALREVPNLRLLVMGRGTHQKEVLTDPVRRLGLEHAVIHDGYRGDDYLDALAQLNALVFLVPGSDGSCRAVLEAMSMEIPPIASRRGALPSTVTDRKTGRLVDESVESLAAAFIDLSREPERWREWGRAARRSVLEKHAVAHYAQELEKLYHSAIQDQVIRSGSAA